MTKEKDDVRSLNSKFSEVIDKIESEAHDKIKYSRCVFCNNEAVVLIKKDQTYAICGLCFRPMSFGIGDSMTYLKRTKIIRLITSVSFDG